MNLQSSKHPSVAYPSAIGHQEIKKRIDSLDKVIPSKQQIEQKCLARIAEIKSRLEAIDEIL
jgi:hypothetical protein